MYKTCKNENSKIFIRKFQTLEFFQVKIKSKLLEKKFEK